MKKKLILLFSALLLTVSLSLHVSAQDDDMPGPTSIKIEDVVKEIITKP